MNHHPHNFVRGMLFSASRWNYVNYQHSYLFVQAACKCISPERLFRSRSKEETGKNKMFGVAWRVEVALWELVIAVFGGSLPWKCSAGDLTCGVLSTPGAELGASTPTPAPLASSSSRWCPEKNVPGSFKEALECCATPAGVLGGGRCNGNVTQRGGAAPAHTLLEHVPGRLEGLGASLPALLLSRVKSLFS